MASECTESLPGMEEIRVPSLYCPLRRSWTSQGLLAAAAAFAAAESLPGAVAATATVASSKAAGCDARCSLNGNHATCGELITREAATAFADSQDACVKAYQEVSKGCSNCSGCALVATDCGIWGSDTSSSSKQTTSLQATRPVQSLPPTTLLLSIPTLAAVPTIAATSTALPQPTIATTLESLLLPSSTNAALIQPTPEVGVALAEYLKGCFAWLHESPYQGCISAAMAIVGLCCAWDGPGVWLAVFTVCIAACAASIAHYEVDVAATDLAPDAASEGVLIVQVAVAVALATVCGFEGSQVLFGVVVGFVGAHGSSGWARYLDRHLHGVLLFWHSVGVALGGLVFTVWRNMVFATLAPLVGGFLVASGGGMAASRALADSAPAMLPQPDAAWMDAASALLGPTGHGALAGACMCAILAVVLHGCGDQKNKLLAVSSLVGSIAVTLLAALLSPKPMGWQWPLFGSFIWASITSAGAWRQLYLLQDWQTGAFKSAFDKYYHSNAPGLSRGYDSLAHEGEEPGWAMPDGRSGGAFVRAPAQEPSAPPGTASFFGPGGSFLDTTSSVGGGAGLGFWSRRAPGPAARHGGGREDIEHVS